MNDPRGSHWSSLVAHLAKAIERDADAAVLLRDIRRSGEVVVVLRELLAHPSGDVRSWVVWAAKNFFVEGVISREDASSLLSMVAIHDRDGDNEDAATHALVEIDPKATRRLLPSLRRRIKSKDYYRPISAMWELAGLSDIDAIPTIREFIERTEPGTWRAKEALIILAVLERDDDSVVRGIAGHDHGMMPALTRAARLLATPSLKRALSRCSVDAPDAECRRWCADSMEQIEAG